MTETLSGHVLRPASGGTRQGQRPERYRYWRVGHAAAGGQPLDFWISQAGEYHGRANYFYRATEWEQANWNQFYYFLSGETRFSLSGMEHLAGPGDFLILPAGFSIEGQSEREIRFHWFALQGRWPVALGPEAAVQRIACGKDPILADRFVDLREALILQRPGHVLRGVAIFYAILARLQERGLLGDAPPKEVPSYPEAVRNAIIYLQEYYVQPFDAGRVANASGVSASHLRALFERWLGEAPRSYHARLRIEEAARLLREQQLSVLEVAMKVGFRDRSNFSRLFKRSLGVAPSRYLAVDEGG